MIKTKMGKSNSKPKQPKQGKDIDDQKMIRIGLNFGRGDLKIERNFQCGFARRAKKKYDENYSLVNNDQLDTQTQEQEHDDNTTTE